MTYNSLKQILDQPRQLHNTHAKEKEDAVDYEEVTFPCVQVLCTDKGYDGRYASFCARSTGMELY